MIPGQPDGPGARLSSGRREDFRLILVEPDGRDQVWSWPQLEARIHATALQARAAGIRRGDPALLLFEHGLPAILSFLGLAQAGAAPCLLPYISESTLPASASEAERLAEALDARWLVTSCERCNDLAQQLKGSQLRVLGLDSVQDRPAERAAFFLDDDRSPDETAYFQLTSGTTDLPKIIAVPFGKLHTHTWALHDHLEIGPNDRFVGWLPLHHDMGLIIQLWLPLICGAATAMIAPDYWVRRPRTLFQAVDRYRGTVTFMPNFAFCHASRFVREKELGGLDLSCWRKVINGAEPVRVEDMQNFARLLEPHGFRQRALGAGYGLGENVGGVTITPTGGYMKVDWISGRKLQDEQRAETMPAGEQGSRPIASCGVPIPGTEIAIFDEKHHPVPDRALGEIAVRGSSVCCLYGGVAARPIPGSDGWFLPGDIGYQAEGQLYVCDRKSDLIIIGGRNIHPQMIESLAVETIGLKAGHAAAFGIPNALLGTELPVVVCEVRGRANGEQERTWAAEIRRRVHSELRVVLADVRLVRRGWVVQTTSGKVARAATREKYRDAGYTAEPLGFSLLRSARHDPARLEGALTALAAQMLGHTVVDPGINLFELGGDSITVMRFVLTVEEACECRVSTVFFEDPTVAHMADLLSGEDGQAKYPAPLEAKSTAPSVATRFFSQRRPFYHLLARKGPYLFGRALPYGPGVRLQRAWLSTPFARWMFYRELEVLKAWAAIVGEPDLGNAVRRNLMSNTWTIWRNLALSRKGEVDRWMTITGERRLLLARPEPSRGTVVAMPHIGRLIRPMHQVAARSGRKVATIVNDARFPLEDRTRQSASRSSQLWQAHRVLQEGGIVFIAADGLQGRHSIPVQFWGRSRPFKLGSAQLAIETGSSFVPVFGGVQLDGRVEIVVTGPLEGVGTTDEERVIDLTARYAALYGERWPEFYASMNWNILAFNLNPTTD